MLKKYENNSKEGLEKNQSLGKKMASRHIMMLALGGVIGAGLFKGSSSAIALAGPAVLISYLIGGIILYLVMKSIQSLVLSSDNPEGLSGLVQPYLGSHAADFTDWIYFSLWMLNTIAEAVAAASFLQLWFPHVPSWAFVLIIAVLVSIINLFSVTIFAETEYWLALIKIIVIILLVVLCLFLVGIMILKTNIFTVLSGFTGHGGLAPHGVRGIANSLLIVIYSYGGSELIALTVSEAKNPQESIPRAIRAVIGRIVSFYIIPLFLVLLIYNWKTLANSSLSPFVMVFNKLQIPFATDIINIIIVFALFSSINTGIYASSRLLFFRLKNRSSKISRNISHLNHRKVPQRCIIICSGILYISVLLSYFFGDKLFNYLASSASYSVLLVWLLISLAGLRLSIKIKVFMGKIYSLTAILGLIAIFIGILFTNHILVTVITALLYIIIFLSYQKLKRISYINYFKIF